MAGALLALAGCAACADAAFTVRRGAALAPAAAPPEATGALRVLHLADFGEQTAQQAEVAAGLAAAHRRAPFALAFLAGDNLYPCGPDAARPGAAACTFAADRSTLATPPLGTDPQFERLHDQPLAGLAAAGPPPRVYLGLGNHDVATWPGCQAPGVEAAEAARRQACAEVAYRSPLWSMPGRHYVVDEGPARFIVVDSSLLYADYAGFTLDDELAFAAEAARGCDARACFVVGHHPPATAGGHVKDFTPARSARVARFLAALGPGVRGWLAGHDHDLQHARTAGGLDVFVSGNGATARPTERFERVNDGGQLLFGSVRPGHGVLAVRPDGFSYRFEAPGGAALYCCAATGAGRCEPVTCAP
ncbi:MAG: metallophosphoesterase [Anaeromyxobacter sp.]|nr:metallophosphoesterase [Anaeromyxobacter sp.]MBL0276056.1 metallophosphoesterase [Anaeromyxobacter sp.]